LDFSLKRNNQTIQLPNNIRSFQKHFGFESWLLKQYLFQRMPFLLLHLNLLALLPLRKILIHLNILLNLVLAIIVRRRVCTGCKEGSYGGFSCRTSHMSRLLLIDVFFWFFFRLLVCFLCYSIFAKFGMLSSSESSPG